MNLTSVPLLEYRRGELCYEDTPLAPLAAQFGTPLYVYSETAITENFRAFQQRGVPWLVCYSVKANSNLSVLDVLRQAGAGFDIVSGGELARVVKIKAHPQRIVFSGVGKTIDEIDAALAAGILMFNVESEGELEALEARARQLGRRAPVSIRINPDVEARTHPYISTGESIHKFGVPKAAAGELYRRAAESDSLDIRGVSCHIGSQILEMEPFIEAFDEILGFARALGSSGLEYLDLGGGFGIRYADEPPLDFASLARIIEARLEGSPYRVIVEPGRAIAGNAGLLLARVLYVKRNTAKNFIVVDAGMSDLMRPALYGSYHEIVPVRAPAAGPQLLADIVGPICETGDFLGQDRAITETRPGDLLAVLATGAYGYVLASNYNTRPRPAEILVRGADARLIRARETVSEIIDREPL